MNKFCTSCGSENTEAAQFCKKCGAKLSPDNIQPTEQQSSEHIIVSKTSGKAIASLVLSLLWLYGIGSILAIILGHMARTDVENSKGRLTGGGIALAGLIIGYISLAVVVLGILAAIAIPKLATGQ